MRTNERTNDLAMTFVNVASGDQGGGSRGLVVGGAGKEGEKSMLVGVEGEMGMAVLPEAQQKTMDLLVAGRSITDAARMAGVGRTTVYRWLNGDRVFMEAYEMWQRQRRKNCQSRLLMLSDKATDVLERLLEEGNSTASIQLLKGVGMLGGKRGRKRI